MFHSFIHHPAFRFQELSPCNRGIDGERNPNHFYVHIFHIESLTKNLFCECNYHKEKFCFDLLSNHYRFQLSHSLELHYHRNSYSRLHFHALPPIREWDCFVSDIIFRLVIISVSNYTIFIFEFVRHGLSKRCEFVSLVLLQV